MILYLIALAAALAAYLFCFKKDSNKNPPPGPKGYPIVGNAFSMSKRIEIQFSKWADEYGELTLLNLCGMKTLLLNTPKIVKEVFSLESATGRIQDGGILSIYGDGIARGLVRTDGHSWEQLRRFTLRQLRDFGFGKSSMESMIMEEVNQVLQWMSSQGSNPVGGIREKMSVAVVNSLWTIVSSERLDHDDSFLVTLTSGITKLQEDIAKSGALLLFAPWTRHIAPDFTGYTGIKSVLDKMTNFSEKSIEKHSKTHSTDFSRDFIDVFLNEVKKNTDDPSSAFCGKEAEKNLVAVVVDLFLAGADTTSTTLDFAYHYLASFPDAQKKLQKEITEVTGNSRQVSITDRPSMPYTESLLAEILRCSSIVPVGVPHRALTDFKVNGYDIKKDTVLMANMHYIHYNKHIWGDPLNFRPERFLSLDGKVFKKHEGLVAFSLGRRQCLGETLARDTLFLFITNIFQRFTVIHADPNKVAKDLSHIDLMDSIVPCPKPYKVIFQSKL